MRFLPVLLVAACTTQTDPAGPGARRRCADLEAKTFSSLTQGECGLGPNGPSLCTWHVMFAAADAMTTAFTWQHSDVEESGDVYCIGGDVYDAGSAATRGTYDAASGRLVWDMVTYAP